MITDSDYLIVYGTLQPPFENPFAYYLRQNSQYIGKATFAGQLFDVGNYPGAVYQHNSCQIVLGTLYNISRQKQRLLAYLDEYEGVGAEFDEPTEYIRVQIPVMYTNTILYAWAYLYNLPVVNKPIIWSGDYIQYADR